MARHSRCKFFPKVVESLVVAWQGDVLPDGLWVEALTEVELAISDQGEVGAKFITGDSVKLAYHRCKRGSSSHLVRSVLTGVFNKRVFNRSYCLIAFLHHQLTDCSRTPNS